MSAATSITVTGLSYFRWLPSGSVIAGMTWFLLLNNLYPDTKKGAKRPLGAALLRRLVNR
jgi:hypothetical protein